MNYPIAALALNFFAAKHLNFDVIQHAGGIKDRIRPINAHDAANELDRLLHLYLEDITYQKLHVEDTKVSESLSPAEGSVGRILQRTITTNYIYRFSDSIPVFTEIPDGVYLREDVRESFSEYLQVAPAKVKLILVRDIAKFELLHQPPQAWLDAIAAKQARLEKALAKCQECECLYPVWYHEVVKTPEEYRRLLKPWATN